MTAKIITKKIHVKDTSMKIDVQGNEVITGFTPMEIGETVVRHFVLMQRLLPFRFKNSNQGYYSTSNAIELDDNVSNFKILERARDQYRTVFSLVTEGDFDYEFTIDNGVVTQVE